MFCEIILSQRFPKHLGIFDYQIPANLLSQIKVGQLVTIPFRKSTREGIVLKIKKSGIAGKQIKEILKINRLEPIITPQQIRLAKWMADYYFISLGTVIKTILPPIPKKKSQIRQEKKYSPLPQPTLPIAISQLIYGLLKSKQQKFLFWPKINKQSDQFLYWLIKKIKGQILILVPEIIHIDNLKNFLPKNLIKKTVIIHSQLNKNQFFEAWQSIIKNQAKIIIGTKLALFTPLQKPELIILDQEENQNHKQSDQNPRFDSHQVAEKLSEIHQAKLLLTSHAPQVTTFYKTQQKLWQLLQIKDTHPTPLQLVDIREEYRKGNYSLFSEQLSMLIEKNLAQQKKIFLFINKRGTASSVVCQDCGLILLCKKCQLPLPYHEKNNTLYCHHCNIKSELPPFCPKCSSVNFKFLGLGTQKVEHEARKKWPQAKIARFDKDIEPSDQINKADLIIGTERVFDYLDWKEINLIGVISADTFLHLPDFRSTERTWQLLNHLTYFSQLKIIVQTYTPKNSAIFNFIKQRLDQFYKSELAERKTMAYPPFANFVKLIYQNKDKKACLNEAQRLYRLLKTSPLNISLLTPLTPYIHSKWQMYVVIKYQSPQQDNILQKIITQVPDQWLIDRDPLNLL